MNKRSLLVFGSVLSACLAGGSALSKPNQTTKYTYYMVSGDTPGAIHSALLRQGPRLDGNKSYAIAYQTYSLSKDLVQNEYCDNRNFKLKIEFVIRLPKLRNEEKLTAATRKEWKKFFRFVQSHEETHRRIWLASASELEAKILAIKAKSCEDMESKIAELENQAQTTWAKKQDAFDAEQKVVLERQSFIKLALIKSKKTANALAVVKKKP